MSEIPSATSTVIVEELIRRFPVADTTPPAPSSLATSMKAHVGIEWALAEITL
ncbi:MAG: hypothetical protein Q9213_006496 [Squamulea squamosa]